MSSMLADDTRVTALRERLTADLRSALKARDPNSAGAIRSLLARLDQASAVPLTSEHAPVFGNSGEVARRYLTWNDARRLIELEIDEKRHAIATFEAIQMQAEVERLTQQLDVMRRYRDS